MKKDLLIVPVLLILAIGLALGYRWWSQRTDRGQLTDGTMMIGELDDQGRNLADRLAIPYDDAQQLQAVDETDGSAVVRLSEDGRSLTVAASLPRLSSGAYQVWLQTHEGVQVLGSITERKRELPKVFEIVVSAETVLDGELEQPLFAGSVTRQR